MGFGKCGAWKERSKYTVAFFIKRGICRKWTGFGLGEKEGRSRVHFLTHCIRDPVEQLNGDVRVDKHIYRHKAQARVMGWSRH